MSLNNKKELVEIVKIVSRDLQKTQLKPKLFCDITGRETLFVADFYCHSEKLIFELDGEYHKYRLTEDKE